MSSSYQHGDFCANSAAEDDTLSLNSGSGSLSSNLIRAGSFAYVRNSAMWLGEQAQTQFLDRNLEAHMNDERSARMSPSGSSGRLRANSMSNNSQKMLSSTSSLDIIDTIRFQVIVWSICAPDVKTHRVSMKFRVTIFWNDNVSSSPVQTKKTKMQQFRYVMSGRSTAVKKKVSDTLAEMLDVPPVSILNADSFEVIGQPEVQLLNEHSQLYRWSCMYRAQLCQSDICVDQFPHDEHDLCIKLGILSQRQPGGRWDRRKWKLGLANESDTQGGIRVPYGLLVDDVKIPEFYYDDDGLIFELEALEHGKATRNTVVDRDFCLAVKLRVKRNSGYYDKNIMPLLSVLNLVSISIFSIELVPEASNDFRRSLLSLNIAFVEVGLRMALDNHLPSVGYQIKLQKILNRFFYSILAIVLESNVLSLLLHNGVCSTSFTRKVDLFMAIFLLMHQVYLALVYISFSRWREMADYLLHQEQ